MIATLSCASTKPRLANTPKETLTQFLTATTPDSYASHIKLYFNSKKLGSAKTEALVYFKSPDSYGFILKDFWGGNIISGAIRGDSILVYYPKEGCFIRDRVSRFASSKYWEWKISPLQLFNLLNGSWPVNQKTVRFVEQSGDFYHYESEQEAGRIDLYLTQTEGALRELVYQNTDAGWTARAKLKRIRNQNGFHRPRLIEIRFEGSKDELKAGVVEEKLNLDLADKYFSVEVPDSAENVELDVGNDQ